MCDKCYGFLIDFISLPVDQPLAYYVKSKNIPKVADQLVKEFYRIFQKITPLEHYYIIKRCFHGTHLLQTKEQFISDEHIRGMLKLEALLNMVYKDNISYIIFILEENSIITNKDIQLLWIANCIEHIWIHLENIHNEHTGRAPVSYGGPAVGMKIVKKVEKTQDEIEFEALYN